MVKQRRMGRNLDALLGGASRERSRVADKPAPEQTDPASEASTPTGSEQPADGDASGAEEAREDVQKPAPSDAQLSDQTSLELPVDPPPEPLPADTVETTDRLRMIGVDQIRRGSYQPRRLFDQSLLQELADSIKAEGMIQPILVRRFAGAYELVAGERRWRAAQLAGLSDIPAIVRDMEDQSVAAVALIENIQRKDLNPLEEAAAFERLCDEFGMTHKAVAESVGRSRASVSNLLRLLELHDEVKLLVDKGELEMGHARAILGAPKDRQHELAQQVIKQGLSVRAVEKLVRDLNEPEEQAGSAQKKVIADPDIERLSQKLGETLGASVKIQHRKSGSGKLQISYSSVSELQGILAHIK